MRNQVILIVGCIFFTTAMLCNGESVRVHPASQMTGEYIDWIKKVADWQLTQSTWDDSVYWERGTLHTGMIAAFEATKDDTYQNKSLQWAQQYNWHMASDSRHADNHTCAQTYLELYFLDEQGPDRYAHFQSVADVMVTDPRYFNCDVAGGSEVWWWCDALFMAPPAMVRLSRATGDSSYTNMMHWMWLEAEDCLYDPQEHLFFRDINYFDDRVGGEKVFWSRGNGWVVGGIVRVLRFLPLDDPMRPHYETLFQEMAAKLASLQQPDGYWYSNLLYPEQYDLPESSGTGFFLLCDCLGNQ